MKTLVIVVAAVWAVVAGGCAVTPHKRTTYFDRNASDWSLKKGNGRLAGQAFLRTKGGDVKYAAGREIVLYPADPYWDEWFDVAVKRELPIESPDIYSEAYRKTTMGNGEGRFVFENLAAGQYYIATEVRWTHLSGIYGGRAVYSETGGMIGSKVTVRDGQTTDLVLTR